jgi:hypothetical protein
MKAGIRSEAAGWWLTLGGLLLLQKGAGMSTFMSQRQWVALMSEVLRLRW